MSLTITYVSNNGLDGVTNVSTSSAYEKSTADTHAIVARTGPDGTLAEPIGIIAPRPAIETAEVDLATGEPLALLRTASKQQRTHATDVDDFIAYRIEILTDVAPVGLAVDVINLETGRVTESITMTALDVNLFVGGCVMVSTGHALRFNADPGLLVTRVTLVLEPTDDPNVFAKMCCCSQGGGGSGDTTCCTPAFDPSCFFSDQGEFVQVNTTFVISYTGPPDAGPHVFRVGVDNLVTGSPPTVEVLAMTCGPAPSGTKPVITSVIMTPAVAGTSLGFLDIDFNFTGYDNLDGWLVRVVQPCGCAAVFMLVGGQG